MAEDTFKGYVIAFILFTLVGTLLISSVVLMGGEYGKDTTELGSGAFSYGSFYGNASGVEQHTKNLKASFDSGSVWSALAGVVVEGLFGIALDMVKMILAPFDLTADILLNVFGVPSIVTSVLLGILIIGIILSVWRLIKIGD